MGYVYEAYLCFYFACFAHYLQYVHPLINEHLCIVNIPLGPKGVHYMELLLYFKTNFQWFSKEDIQPKTQIWSFMITLTFFHQYSEIYYR